MSSASTLVNDTLTAVPGLRVGHATDARSLTGCTVILCPAAGCVGGVDVRGSAPGTRETDLLRPGQLVERVNAYLLAYWAKEVSGADLSRSRPYHKNDNRFVEQKNSSEVRAYFGSQRLDTTAQTSASTRLYDKLWVYYNLFQPVMHMDKKTFLPTEQGPVTVKRHYDDARPPFDRLCATKTLAADKQEELERLRDQTNPRRLKQDIYDLLDYILALPCADSCTS